jgi:hypothetical protein
MLDKLEAFIDGENTKVAVMYGSDKTRAEEIRDSRIAEANRILKERLAELQRLVDEKQADEDKKKAILDTAEEKHDRMKTEHLNRVASLGEAKASHAQILATLAGKSEADRTSCDANADSQVAQADAQFAKDAKYLDQALGFIADLEDKIYGRDGLQDTSASTAAVSSEATCADAVCPKKKCADGNDPRQVGSDCCSCAETEQGRVAREAAGGQVDAQVAASNDAIAVKVRSLTPLLRLNTHAHA